MLRVIKTNSLLKKLQAISPKLQSQCAATVKNTVGRLVWKLPLVVRINKCLVTDIICIVCKKKNLTAIIFWKNALSFATIMLRMLNVGVILCIPFAKQHMERFTIFLDFLVNILIVHENKIKNKDNFPPWIHCSEVPNVTFRESVEIFSNKHIYFWLDILLTEKKILGCYLNMKSMTIPDG